MTKTEFLEIFSKRYDELQSLNKLDNFYDYEKEINNIMRTLSKEILEKNLGVVPPHPPKKPYSPPGETS
ncbi:MAG: hypothetical protein QM541_14430 [Flavobacterium sp.]|nr:hypothetical protein [Flavobacterium sp.]